MSGANGTCDYVLDPDDPETWGGEEGDTCYVDGDVLNEDGVWNCPHDSEEGADLCIFHLPVETKNDREVVERIININKTQINEGNDKKLRQFIGGRFGKVELLGLKLQCLETDDEVNFSHSTFHGKCLLKNSLISLNKLIFNGCSFKKDVSFKASTLNTVVSFKHSKFLNNIDCRRVKFKNQTIFSAVEVLGVAYFNDSTFHNKLSFRNSKLATSGEFNIVDFEGLDNFGNIQYANIYFDGVNFKAKADFTHTNFRGDVYFRSCKSDNKLTFVESRFHKKSHFNNSIFLSDVSFSGSIFNDKAVLRNAKFAGNISLLDVEFNNKVVFSGAEINGDADFRAHGPNNIDISGGNFSKADLTGVDFTRVNLTGSDFESAILSRATLFGADLRGSKLSGAVLGDARIDEDTKFLGHPSADSDSSPHTFSAIRSQPTCVYDPNYVEDNEHENVDKAKSVYRALEELGGKHARPRLQARSFVRRQDLQKQDYWDGATADDASLEERLIAGARYSRAKVARATLLYGESPWRVVAWSLGIILSFGLLYPLGGWMKADEASEPISYSQISVDFLSDPLGWLGGFSNVLADSLYYSTLTYTALGFGDFKPVDLGRLLTSIETGLGAVMLALLVFILGRRAAR